MKHIIKLLFVLVVGAVVAPLFIKGPDGKPLMQISDLLPAEALPNSMTQPQGIAPSVPASSQAAPQSGGAIYRWQDEHGQWHYSDKAPAHVRSESVTLQPVNTIPAAKPRSAPEGNTQSPMQSDAAPARKIADLTSGLPDNLGSADAAALLEQAKETQRIIQERQAQIDALMKNQ